MTRAHQKKIIGKHLLSCLTLCGSMTGLVHLAHAQAPLQEPTPSELMAMPATPAASSPGTNPTEKNSANAAIDKLVAPIALYPDDLVSIILPGSTYPIQIVQADRFLDKRKKDKNAKIDEKWPDPIKALVNYPEVVKKMSTELDWTTALGEAVTADQGAVLEGVQRFRRQTLAAGNLKTDEKQIVIVEKEVVKIAPANPEVIYVPQYNPTTVVVYGYSGWGYYPAPYPVYYYPYPPGSAFAAGVIWGAAIGAAWHGGHYVTHYGSGSSNININHNTNINVNNPGANKPGTKPGTQPGNAGGQSKPWTPEKGNKPSTGMGSTNRPGDAGSRGQSSTRPSSQPAGMAGAGAGVSNRAGSGGDAFGSYGSGSSARSESARGASSRSASSGGAHRSPQARPSAGSRPSGARAGGGGGGGRRR